jgi:predicted nucleic acid-binding protein
MRFVGIIKYVSLPLLRLLIVSLSKHRDMIETVRALRLHVEPTTLDLLDSAAKLSIKHQLLTTDSLTIATMEKSQLRDLVTNEDNFDSMTGLQVWKPR